MFTKPGIHAGLVENMLAGEDPHHVVLLVALDADCAVIEVGVCLLITLFYCSGGQFADGFLGGISKTTL